MYSPISLRFLIITHRLILH